jgi:cyclic nucleotide gated channel
MFCRFHNNAVANMDSPGKFAFEVENNQYQGLAAKQSHGKNSTMSKLGRLFEPGSSKVYSEGHETNQSEVLDPRGIFLHRWNRVFVFSCLATLFVDPLFYYLPKVNEDLCLEVDSKLRIVVTVLRSITDLFHLIHIGIQFRTGYIIPSERIVGRGELVTDLMLIARNYLQRHFIIDLVAIIPLPQASIILKYALFWYLEICLFLCKNYGNCLVIFIYVSS